MILDKKVFLLGKIINKPGALPAADGIRIEADGSAVVTDGNDADAIGGRGDP